MMMKNYNAYSFIACKNIHSALYYTSTLTWPWQLWKKGTFGPSFMYQRVSVCLHEWWSRWRYTSMISSVRHLVRPVLDFSLFVFHPLTLFAFPTITWSSSHDMFSLSGQLKLTPAIYTVCLSGCPKRFVGWCPIIAMTQADFCLGKIYYPLPHKQMVLWELIKNEWPAGLFLINKD